MSIEKKVLDAIGAVVGLLIIATGAVFFIIGPILFIIYVLAHQ